MASSMSANCRGIDNQLVAVEIQGPEIFYVDLINIEKYHQLHRQITCHVPTYIYDHAYNVLGYIFYQSPGLLYINLHTVPQGAGHILWEYLVFGTLALQGNPFEGRREEYFKSIIYVHNFAEQFGMEDLKSDSAKEIFREAQDMGLVELLKLLEEVNYRSNLFPKFSVYLEKRLVSSALDYDAEGSLRAFIELRDQPSLSVAQMLLKAMAEVSNIECRSGKQDSMRDEAYRKKVAETTAVSEVIGLEECKSPKTSWIKPGNETSRVSKSVGSRFFEPAAKQQDRSRMGNRMEEPLQRGVVPESTFYSSTEPEFIPPSTFLPSLVPRPEGNGTGLLPPFGDTSKRSRSRTPPHCDRLSPMGHKDQTDAMSQAMVQHIRQNRQRMAEIAFAHMRRKEHNPRRKSLDPNPSTASGELESESAVEIDNDTADEAEEACNRPVTQIGSQLNFAECILPSFDEPWQSSTSSSDTLEGDPGQVEGSMDWDAGSSESDYNP
ncbi:uncharacterized protein FFB20_01812 [Fusarium fujikuroi]|nr:uncharacterized protein FFB20_01812 [Fusarium fujikuroi]SCO01659.1 uncharacterized protein FFC1_08971 [Fusarium fujikuroi]SCO47066.1 uncharacterized protein FFNC_11132 [Fusarium fujikuroi]SCO55795.1 uncharacterized protein FFMR_12951 [Fusarium fujikuroi]